MTMPNRQWIIEDGKIPDSIIKYISSQKGKYVISFEKYSKKRSNRQNATLHLWFNQLSDTFNKDGIDMRAVIRPEIDLMWTPWAVKEYLWRPVQKALYGEKSTTKLNTEKINKIVDFINKAIGERVGIYIPFPSMESWQE